MWPNQPANRAKFYEKKKIVSKNIQVLLKMQIQSTWPENGYQDLDSSRNTFIRNSNSHSLVEKKILKIGSVFVLSHCDMSRTVLL